MNSKVAILLLGLATLSAANYPAQGRLRQGPARSYAAPPPPAPTPLLSTMAPVVEEEAVQEREEAVYKAPVKVVHRVPVRVQTQVNNNNDYASSNSGYRHEESRYAHEEEQARNAKYSFGSAIDDGIMDHSHVRQESRDGLKVEGSYAYSDGFFKRVVNYVADENGYRVVSESVEPISETGPNIDLVHGKAEVHTQISGVDNQYSVSAQDMPAYKIANIKH